MCDVTRENEPSQKEDHNIGPLEPFTAREHMLACPLNLIRTVSTKSGGSR